MKTDKHTETVVVHYNLCVCVCVCACYTAPFTGKWVSLFKLYFLYTLHTCRAALQLMRLQILLDLYCTSFIEKLLLSFSHACAFRHLSVSAKVVVDSFPAQWSLVYFIMPSGSVASWGSEEMYFTPEWVTLWCLNAVIPISNQYTNDSF